MPGPRIQIHYDDRWTTPLQEPIHSVFNCGKCIKELPSGVSPKEYARTQLMIAKGGHFQLWCNRHECNIAVITMTIKVEEVPTEQKG